ncbi:uncharacterized protein BN494_00786 [Eggerthella sp. CAG:1427]|nr:uncharacterized protein BN494_00786 [Eggerthella sp. CAG:1427]
MAEFYNPEVQQIFPDSCAIKSQQLILNDFGIEVSEVDLVQTAAVNGWYNGGTAPQDVGNLLELANIPVTRQEGANVFNLVNELAQGHKVIVGLDADEMWHNDSISDKLKNWYNDFFGEPGGNHALIVAGIDTSDPNNIQVIVKDPGSGDDGKPYPLDQFMDAWSDANCYMVSTDMSAPEFAEGMQNFDQELGHIPDVAGVSYPDFQIFNDISMGLPPFMPMGDFVPPIGSFVPPMPTMSPMTSLTNAYFDFANNNIGFNDIFSNNYMFNDYLDCGLVNDYMRPTCFDGFNDINWCDIQPMGYNMPMDFDRFALAGMGVDYNMFYNDCMSQFNAIGDFNSMALCQQQLDIMSYCDCNCMDYSTDFLMYM